MDPKIEKAMKSAFASVQLEGLNLTEEAIQTVREKLMGKITEEEFLKRSLDLAKKTGKDKED